jgi:hypothetical protein
VEIEVHISYTTRMETHQDRTWRGANYVGKMEREGEAETGVGAENRAKVQWVCFYFFPLLFAF